MQQGLKEWWIINSFCYTTRFAAVEEGFIVTNNRSVTLGKYKTKTKQACLLILFHNVFASRPGSLCLNSCSQYL